MAVVLISSGKKQISPLFPPLEKLLKKSTGAPPGKHSFDTHALQNYTIFRINCVVFYHLATLFSNTNVVSKP